MNPETPAWGSLCELAVSWEKELSESTSPEQRGERMERLVQLYLQILSTDPAQSVRRDFALRLLSLHALVPIDATLLETVAEIADDHGDTDIYRRVLELLASDDDPDVKTRALERLGDLFVDLGDRRAAVESWKPAALIRQSWPAAQGEARRLYERVLDTLPDDEAAERLVHIYADANDWERIPEAVGVVIRADRERAAEIVLGLERSARVAGALDPYVSMVDEATALQAPSSATARCLRRAKARALAGDPARHQEASATYRALLETFGHDEDRREYQAFLVSKSSSPEEAEQACERRWLYRWRVKHEERPLEALLEWAKGEEEQGDLEEAFHVYRRALTAAPEEDRPALALKIARSMLAHRTSGALVVERIEEMAEQADDATAAALFAFLVESRDETASLTDARRRWYRRALSRVATALSLESIVRGAGEMPDEILVWDAAERMGRETGELGVVVHAYGETLIGGRVDAELAEVLGRRMIALEEESAVEPSFLADALESVLHLAPRARWALDRVKLVLGAQGQWDALFSLYDRAITAADGTEREELLREAAFVARDLADGDDRAIGYFATIHAMRPTDDNVATALERLYERQDRKIDLIALISERAAQSEPSARREHQRRIAALWFDLGRPDEAAAVAEAMLLEGAVVGDVTELLERVASHPGQARATEHLSRHYETMGKVGDVVRLAERALLLAPDAAQRGQRMRELVRARILAAEGAPDVFARAMERVASDVAANEALAKVAYRAALLQAIAWRKRATTDAELEDALSGAWRAIAHLKAIFLEVRDPKGASRLLARGAQLRFDLGRQRGLLQQAALLSSELVDERERALRLFSQIFHEDSDDDIARGMLDRFAGLLEAAGKYAKLASLWEEQAGHHASGKNPPAERACWVRSAALWEQLQDVERAVTAYERAAALESEESYEALARLHAARAEWAKAVAAQQWLHAHSSGETRARRALQLADVHVELGQRDHARACLEEVRGPTEIARGARARLIALYRQDGIWRSLADALSAEAAETEDGKARAALYAEAASVVHAKLAAPADAARLLELALAAAPDDGSLRPKLADLLEELGEWSRVADVLHDQAALSGERRSKDRALLHHRMARALLRADRAGDALVQLKLAARMHPTHPAILCDIAQVSLRLGDLDLAERTNRALLLALRHPTEPCEPISSTRILLDLGAIALRKGDAARAANLFESGLDAALEKREDATPFEQALRDLGRHDLAVRAAEARVVGGATSGARAAALRDLATAWREHLGREPRLGARLRSYADASARALGAQGTSDDDGDAWAALWSVYSSLDDAAALLAMNGELPALLGRRLQALGADVSLEATWKLGDALERAGRTADAARLYEATLDRAQDLETFRALEKRLEALGSPRLADCLEQRVKLGEKAAPGLAQRLLALREAQRDDAAIVRALELGLAADPTNRTFLDRLVRAHEEQWDWAAVTRVLRCAFAAAPEDRALRLRLADAHRAMGAEQEAMRLLDAAIADAPTDAELLTMRARACEAIGDDAGAVRDIRSIGHRGDVDAIVEILGRLARRAASAAADEYGMLLVEILVHAKRSDDARRELDALVTRNPDHREAVEKLASLDAAAGDWEQAAAAYAHLVRLVVRAADGDRRALPRAVVAFADACDRAGSPGAARETLERALLVEPDDEDVRRRLEHACEASGDHTRLSDLLVARAQRTADGREKSKVLLRAANILTGQGRGHATALPLFERAILADPQNMEAALSYARTQMAFERPREALTPLRDAIERNRRKRSPLLAAAYLEMGKAHLALDELAEAFEALKAGFAIDMRNGELAMVLGLVAVDLADAKTAERALLAAATLPHGDEASPTVDRGAAYYHLAAVAHANGDATKARRWVEKALREDPAHQGALGLLERFRVSGVRELGVGARKVARS